MKQTTLCYIENDGKVLMLYRNKKEIDINKGKWIGVGGHVEENETIDECLIREVKEETGLSLLEYKRCGKLIFYIDNIVEECYLYRGLSFTGELITCSEGELKWVAKNDVLDLNLWEGDKHFLPKLLNQEDFFTMKLIYDNNDNLIEIQ